jgi:hypothetical protein
MAKISKNITENYPLYKSTQDCINASTYKIKIRFMHDTEKYILYEDSVQITRFDKFIAFERFIGPVADWGRIIILQNEYFK